MARLQSLMTLRPKTSPFSRAASTSSKRLLMAWAISCSFSDSSTVSPPNHGYPLGLRQTPLFIGAAHALESGRDFDVVGARQPAIGLDSLGQSLTGPIVDGQRGRH